LMDVRMLEKYGLKFCDGLEDKAATIYH